MKTNSKIFFFILFVSFIIIPINSFTPYANAASEEYISATDILKNFKFETLEKYLESIKLNNIDHTFETIKNNLDIGDLEIHDINKDYGTYIMGGG